MAYQVSQDFKTAIKDQTAQKSCLILFDDLFFSTSDFTDSGVVFNQFFNTSEDLTFGDCPSDTLSFSVVANGALAGYSFGKCRAYLGVQTDSSAYAFGSINAHIEVGAYTYTASSSGLYRDSTKIDNGEYVSLISDGTTIWAVGLSSSVSVNNGTGAVSAFTPNRFMARKLRSGLSAVFDNLTAYLWDGTNVITFEYVPMGVYLAEKPRSTVGDTVVVQDAYDQMKLFDSDATAFLDSLTYPRTLSQIYTALCDFVGVSYASSTFTYSTTSYASSPFSDTSCSLRDILWWIAERSRTVAHFNRIGQLELKWLRFPETAYEDIPIGSGSVVTFQNTVDGSKTKVTATITPIQSGSGDPSPDNVRPISGWSEAKVTRTGINMWDEETLNGYYSSGTGAYIYNARQLCSKNFIPVKPNTQYLYQKSVNLGDILFYNAHMEFISAQINKSANAVFTTPENAYYLQINLGSVYGAAYNNDVGINYPHTDTSYHPYVGTTVTIDLDGTRYGGTLDVTRGKLVVTWAGVLMKDQTIITRPTQQSGILRGAFAPTLPVRLGGGIFVVKSNALVSTDSAGTYTNGRRVENSIGNNTDSNYIHFFASDKQTASAWQTFATDNNVQVVYELATPIEVDLTPTEITTLLGTNNIFADTGDVDVILSVPYLDVETLTASDIGQDGYSVAEYLTPAVTGVLLKGTNGSSLTFGTLDTPYVISANPFVSTISASDLNGYWAIPRYVPMELNVLEADPSVDVGDLISVKPMVDEVVLLANVYDEIYVNNNLEAYALNAPEYSIPLMERTVTFIGGIRAKYVATGNEVRDADISNTEYNANVAAKIAEENIDKEFTQQEVFNRLTNNGQAQGIFLDSNGNLYVNGTYIQAHTVAVDKLTGTIHDSGNTWSIDFTTGTITIGTLNADNINGGTISGSSINLGSGNFVVDGSTGAVTINSGSINLGSGVFTVSNAGAVSASNLSITGGRISVQGTAMNDGRVEVTYLTSPTAPYSEYKSILQPAMLINRLVVNYGNGTITQAEADVRYDRLQFVDGGTDLSSYEDVACTIKSTNGSYITILPPSTSGKYITIQPVVVSTW